MDHGSSQNEDGAGYNADYPVKEAMCINRQRSVALVCIPNETQRHRGKNHRENRREDSSNAKSEGHNGLPNGSSAGSLCAGQRMERRVKVGVKGRHQEKGEIEEACQPSLVHRSTSPEVSNHKRPAQ